MYGKDIQEVLIYSKNHENKLQIQTWPYCARLDLLLHDDSQGSSAAVASVTGLPEAALSQPAACCHGQTAAVPV